MTGKLPLPSFLRKVGACLQRALRVENSKRFPHIRVKVVSLTLTKLIVYLKKNVRELLMRIAIVMENDAPSRPSLYYRSAITTFCRPSLYYSASIGTFIERYRLPPLCSIPNSGNQIFYHSLSMNTKKDCASLSESSKWFDFY